MVGYYIFPKIFGLIERSWNASPKWAKNPFGNSYTKYLQLYNAKIYTHELPRLSKKEINFRIPPAGIAIIKGVLYANTPISNAEIRYTTDGTEPNQSSLLWERPIKCDVKDVRAKVFYQEKESVTTYFSRE